MNYIGSYDQKIDKQKWSTYSGGSRIFPRGGREPSRGGVNTPNFPENCMKSKEFGRPGGGVRPSRPPRSANDLQDKIFLLPLLHMHS